MQLLSSGFRNEPPYYLPLGQEVEIFEQCHAHGNAVMLKGPTGSGKTRFVEYMAWRLQRPLVTVAGEVVVPSTSAGSHRVVRVEPSAPDPDSERMRQRPSA